MSTKNIPQNNSVKENQEPQEKNNSFQGQDPQENQEKNKSFQNQEVQEDHELHENSLHKSNLKETYHNPESPPQNEEEQQEQPRVDKSQVKYKKYYYIL